MRGYAPCSWDCGEACCENEEIRIHPMLLMLYQGSITLFASFFAKYMDQGVIADLTSVGGILLIGLGFNILDIKKIKVTYLLPALVVIVVLSYFFC